MHVKEKRHQGAFFERHDFCGKDGHSVGVADVHFSILVWFGVMPPFEDYFYRGLQPY
jgi:hypothetical protein